MAALVNGGVLPTHVRGKTLKGFIHECGESDIGLNFELSLSLASATMLTSANALIDWYATFCRLAGVDVYDERAAVAGLPQPDSHDVWDLIIGANDTSPRYEWPITPLGEDTVREDCGGDAAYMAEGKPALRPEIVGLRFKAQYVLLQVGSSCWSARCTKVAGAGSFIRI